MSFRAPAPRGYVAGAGRGATGFTTRSDLGNFVAPEASEDRKVQSFGQAPAGYVPGAGRGSGGFGETKPSAATATAQGTKSNAEVESAGGINDDAGIFANADYDHEDRQADDAYAKVDEAMDSRRKERRERREREEMEDFRRKTPKIQEQFSGLKRQLATVSASEWEAIPEIGDMRGKKSARREEQYTPVPDSLLEQARQERAVSNQVSSHDQGGLETPASADLTSIGTGRNQVIQVKLDRMSDSVTGQTNIDPKSYLSGLKSQTVIDSSDVADIKKSRMLLDSVIHTNPSHAPGWIAAARLEEVAGKLVAARGLANDGCKNCPKSEDMWLEAARLHTPENAKRILANAVEHLPQCVNIWVQVMALEGEVKGKVAVLQRALELIPGSVRLWKSLVELVDPADARVLLGRAVECCPLSVDIWLALARLETYDNARKVLNRARTALPAEPAIWMTAAQLEEANSNTGVLDRLIAKAISTLEKYKVHREREQWIAEAEMAEDGGFVGVCGSIVRNCIGASVELQDRKRTWLDDASTSLAGKHPATARAIYAHALTVFESKNSVWLAAAMLEKQCGDAQALSELLERGTKACPHAETLWLMNAKEQWLAGDVGKARVILQSAFGANPDSADIWLAAVKLENENNEPALARTLLAKARASDVPDKERIWLKSALLEREQSARKQEKELLQQAVQPDAFATCAKLWLMLCQWEQDHGQWEQAKLQYLIALKQCADCVPLHIGLARLEQSGHVVNGSLNTARSRLEKARRAVPHSPELWLEAVTVELRAGNAKVATQLLAKALQDCPSSGLLWAQAIELEPRQQRKARSVDALKKCEQDPIVICTIAKLFWADRKLPKARSWFNRAVSLDGDNGDNWAWFYLFLQEQGTPEELQALEQQCAKAEPVHGLVWPTISKQPQNFRKTISQVLQAVAEKLGEDAVS